MVAVGYSGAPLPKKLGIKDGHTVALVGAPATWSITGLGPDVAVRRRIGSRPDVVIAFVNSLSELRRRSPGLVSGLGPQASLWLPVGDVMQYEDDGSDTPETSVRCTRIGPSECGIGRQLRQGDRAGR